MAQQLKDKVAIVTGGSRGIGRSICRSLASEGARVLAVARDAAKLAELAAEAKSANLSGTIEPCVVDMSKRQEIDQAVERILSEKERIDILVNNAGITRDGLLANMEDDQFDEVITVNLRSVFWMTRACTRPMIRARQGRIVNLSSVSGISGNAGQANYAASKAGLIGFSKSVARELAKRNITCNVVAPGFIVSDMTDVLPDAVKEGAKTMIPLNRFGTPEDIASAVTFLVGPGAGYITGHVLVVDGGMRM